MQRYCVLIVGGSGVFGSRLANLLGHHAPNVSDIVLGGRRIDSLEATRVQLLKEDISVNVTCVQMERDNAEHVLRSMKPTVVVDAAGPFQLNLIHSDDPLAFARQVIAHDAHYIDLSDASDYTQKIAADSQLQDMAMQRNRVALSGASSTPALSSAIVRGLCDAHSLAKLDVIQTDICPGNRAPRGMSVMQAILSQVGHPMQLWRGGCYTNDTYAWSQTYSISLFDGPNTQRRRTSSYIGAPELSLFPKLFAPVKSVLFGASLELSMLHNSLAATGFMISKFMPSFSLDKYVGVLHKIASWFESQGTDIGGMRVQVIGRKMNSMSSTTRVSWHFTVKDGRGPYIPGLATLLLVNKIDALPPGARAAVTDLSFAEVEDGLTRIIQSTAQIHQEVEPCPSIIEMHLGHEIFAKLPHPILESHRVYDRLYFVGTASVQRGRGILANFIGWLFNFPDETDQTSVKVRKEKQSDGSEIWQRTFHGNQIFYSQLHVNESMQLFERFGTLHFQLQLSPTNNNNGLIFEIKECHVFGLIPLPSIFMPTCETEELQVDVDTFSFSVKLSLPLNLGLLVHYKGNLTIV